MEYEGGSGGSELVKLPGTNNLLRPQYGVDAVGKFGNVEAHSPGPAGGV